MERRCPYILLNLTYKRALTPSHSGSLSRSLNSSSPRTRIGSPSTWRLDHQSLSAWPKYEIFAPSQLGSLSAGQQGLLILPVFMILSPEAEEEFMGRDTLSSSTRPY